MKHITHLFFVFILSIITFSISAKDHPPIATNGILDLREYGDKLEVIRLSGEWEFYWEEFILENDSLENKTEPIIVSVPSYWSQYSEKIPSVKNFGYGSYRLKILFPKNYSERLSLKVPVFDSSFELYVNGKLAGQNGKVGKSSETSDPFYDPFIYYIHSYPEVIELVFHVANYDHRRGGFWKTMELGKYEILDRKGERSKAYTYSLIGLLFGSFLLFLVFFIFEKKNKSFIYFSIASLGVLMRLWCTDNYAVNLLFDVSWEWIVRFEYLGTLLVYIFGMNFYKEIFPGGRLKTITNINTIVFSLLGVLILFLKVSVFSYFMLFLELCGLLFLLYYIIISFMGMLKKKQTETIFFFSMIVFLIAVLNDTFISYSASGISFNYIIPIGFFVLIVAHALILIMNWISTYNEKLALSNELKYINKNLEGIIEKRTLELQNTNKELQSTIDFKSRIYSIIAHDLKSPISSLAQYSDLLIQQYRDTKTASVMNELHDMAYSSVDLIDNLLHWGMKQGRRYRYDPAVVRINKITNDIANLHKLSAEKKNITISVAIPEEIIAYCDESLLRIIMRNLITNAIKFTKVDGSINIKAKNQKDQVMLEVIDDGVGMNQDTIDKIQSSNVLSARGTEGEKGTGLGLQVVRELVTINKGTLSIESKPGRGTSVMFTLPGKP